jgi:hypothetical protein
MHLQCMLRRDQLPPNLQRELKLRTRTIAERSVDVSLAAIAITVAGFTSILLLAAIPH